MTRIATSTTRTFRIVEAVADAGLEQDVSRFDPAQWHQSIGIARQACARIFRDGGSPADALALFGIRQPDQQADWSKAVAVIAEALCATPARRAA